ncbi:MAG: DUF4139 domain-containing protein [Deferribacteraceae bacterium]|jgi:uncharacterized protein (TIGR02231 family)|nr:DUF4139 domain-containing protein [Deferribacteraceae bacterium]
MRIILLIFICCLPAFAAVQVDSMDIYPRGVKVVFAVDAAPNMSFQLPAAFELESVRPLYSQGITVDYFQKAFISKADAVPETLRALYNSIKAKEEELARLAARSSAAGDQLKMLMNISNRDIAASNPSEYVKSLLAYYVDASTEINLLASKHTELSAELKRLQEDYQNRMPANNDRLIDISMGVRGSGKVLIEAYSPHAGWNPSYKMNLNSKTGELRSILVAQAYQKTGLNYNGAVSFNTQALPRGSMAIPKPRPMVVDFQTANDTSGDRFFMNQVSRAPVAMEMAVAEDAPMVTESLTNFTIAGRGNILGDGTAVAIDLGEQSLKAKLKAVLFRDYSRDAYLVVTLEKIAEPFMQGSAELAVDGKSSGQTQIANYGRGEDVEIAFGFMPLIKVNKTTNVSKTGSTGLISKGTLDEGYELEVVNGSSLTMDIELLDRLPYSANDKISVENIVIEPAASKNEENVLTWKMTLKAGETKKFKVSYRVKHPADRPVWFR